MGEHNRSSHDIARRLVTSATQAVAARLTAAPAYATVLRHRSSELPAGV
jgi:hypothetical protein